MCRAWCTVRALARGSWLSASGLLSTTDARLITARLHACEDANGFAKPCIVLVPGELRMPDFVALFLPDARLRSSPSILLLFFSTAMPEAQCSCLYRSRGRGGMKPVGVEAQCLKCNLAAIGSCLAAIPVQEDLDRPTCYLM